MLFADIRGFTRLAESLGTDATIELLREFHERVTRIVFDHGGTLEKYIGDAVMATFGTPSRGVDDAGRALQCAWRLADETHRWSLERVKRGEAPVDLGLGVHYGEAVLGSIGDAQRLDYVVVGDTVNVASRLERLTRDLGVELVVSDAVVGRIREVGRLVGLRLDRLKPGGEVHLTGRMRPITIWTAGRHSTVRSA